MANFYSLCYNLDSALPEYIKNKNIKIILMDSTISKISATTDIFITSMKNCKGDDRISRERYFRRVWNCMPTLHEKALRANCNIDYNNIGSCIVYVYTKEIRLAVENDDVRFNKQILIDIIHECRHAYQIIYWKDFSNLALSYKRAETGYEEGYIHHPLEEDARKWSLERCNYVFGTRYEYK